MRTLSILTATASLGLCFPALGQIPAVEDYIKRTAADPKTASAAECEAGVAAANRLNPAGLFRAASVCFVTEKDVEGNFLLAAGQVRGTADMSLMPPSTKKDMETVTGLYGFIYFHAGGPGKDEVWRDPLAKDRFFSLFDAWTPAAGADYSPDWNATERPSEADYRQALQEMKTHRRAQLSEVTLLYSDADYYSLHRDLQELQARTGSFVVGTPEAELASDLEQRMTQRARELGVSREVPEIDTTELTERTPPSAPGKDETIVSESADPVVKECADWGQQLVRMSLSKIVKVAITTGSKWGVVWRADIASSDEPPEMARLICSAHGTMYEGGDAMDRPALP